MIKKMYFLFFIVFMGCASTNAIKKALDKQVFPITYLYDSKIEEEKIDDGVYIKPIQNNSQSLNKTAQVVKTKGLIVPLLVFNMWDYQYDCDLGESGVQEDIPEFVRKSLIEESERSGKFRIVQSVDSCDYILEMSINDHSVGGPYRENGFAYFALYFYGYNYRETAGPATSHVSLTAKLIKGEDVLFEKELLAEKVSAPLKRQYRKTNELYTDFSNSMVESLSLAYKQVIEEIVIEINKQIINNGP